MRRKLNQYLRTDDHEICLAGFSLITIILSGKIFLGNAFSDQCSVDNSVDGLRTLNCSLLNPMNIYTSAHAGDEGDSGINIEVIYMVPFFSKDELVIDLLGVPFIKYPVKRIIIRKNRIIRVRSGEYTYDLFYLRLYKLHVIQMFEKCTYLEYLEVSSSYFTDPIQFRLPINLKTYNISRNEYRILQIQGTEALEELNANNNPLRNAPILFDDLEPPLTTLRLKGCPLQDMTIVDLARFCFLTFLELDFPPHNRLLRPEGYCNCTMLHQWAKEVSFQIQSLVCYQPKNNEKIECPSKSYFEDARKIHKKCPLLRRGSATMRAIFTVMKYVFFFILVLLLLGTVILYIIRHYHLREWWREHRLRTSAASSIKIEEGEETLGESGSSSEKSIPSTQSYLSINS